MALRTEHSKKSPHLYTSGRIYSGDSELPQNYPSQLKLKLEVGVRYGAPKVSAMWTFQVLEKLKEEVLTLKIPQAYFLLGSPGLLCPHPIKT